MELCSAYITKITASHGTKTTSDFCQRREWEVQNCTWRQTLWQCLREIIGSVDLSTSADIYLENQQQFQCT